MENLEISGKIYERVKVMDFSIINAHFPGYAAHGGMKDKSFTEPHSNLLLLCLFRHK